MIGTYNKIDEERYLSGNENSPREVNVCVSITMHKSIKICVDDYSIIDEYKDEDGNYNIDIDYSTCNLNTPAYEVLHKEIEEMQNNGWDEDEFETILE